jgi:hypothetical protein
MKEEAAMTITLPLQPQEEARLLAVARARGLSPEVIVRAALEKLLADAAGTSDTSATGADLVAAMQASPCKDVEFESRHDCLPVRDVAF